MCVLSIKVPIRKRFVNLFNDPCIYACLNLIKVNVLWILVYMF